MFSVKTYSARRSALRARIGSGLILIPGNMFSPNNYPNNTYNFRQDSTFRYFFGLNVPSLMGVIDVEAGGEELYGDDYTLDDIIWTGPQPTLKEQAQLVGVEQTYPLAKLRERLQEAVRQNRRIHFLPIYRGETQVQVADMLGIAPKMLHAYKSLDLMFAVAEMREIKSSEEIEALERAFPIGYKMHTTAMRMCRPGVVEQEISGTIEGIARAYGQGVSFPSIVSQHGETLHNLRADGVLESGRLLLCDAGGESNEGYCTDNTRTYPVNGKFTQKQKDCYNIVLAAHDHVASIIRPNMMFVDIHNAALKKLAEGLIGIGLIKGSADTAVESGAVGGLFMPHGLGHGMGMDVHDCEAMGERSFSFKEFEERAAQSETCVYRAGWRVKPGTVMTDEPGLYFIPALMDKCRQEGLYKGIVDYDALDAYRDFGGIRIEDDVLVTEDGCHIIGDKKIPVTVEELEAVVGK